MKKRIASYLFAPRVLILAVAASYFCLISTVWLQEPIWGRHQEMFVSTLLFVAAVALVLNKTWSNLLAATISAQLPLAMFYDFWMFAKNAEIELFSQQHFHMLASELSSLDGERLLWCALSLVMLTLSVSSICCTPTVRRLP
ncbi:MAG TPA: hypothetical protein VF656_13445 [Pyrinomonadaceae bacterium]